jgi:hypothetical protein
MIRPSNQQSLKEVIDELINAYRLKEGLDEAKLRELWELMMGKMIASKTTGIDLHGNELKIRISSSVLRQELIYRQDEIKKALNEALDNNVISIIRFS